MLEGRLSDVEVVLRQVPTCLLWRGGPIYSFGSRRRSIRTQEMSNIFEYMSDAIVSISAGLTVFGNKDLRLLGREERWFGFSTQTQRHVTSKAAECTHPRRRRCGW